MQSRPDDPSGRKRPHGDLPDAARTVAAMLFTAGCMALVLLVTLDGSEPGPQGTGSSHLNAPHHAR